MAISTLPSQLTIALIGNPNTGKSTLFNALCGVRQRVGNYPGVTVEKKIGTARFHERSYSLVDLPGTYSLAPRSPDEMVAVDVLLGRRADTAAPDAVLCIVDASNLERNLYLVSQVLELGRPTVIALNMVDVARQRHITIDVERLERQLGVAVVAVQANRRIGLESLQAALVQATVRPAPQPPTPFPTVFRDEVTQLQQFLSRELAVQWPRYLAERLLLDTGGYVEQAGRVAQHDGLKQYLQAARQRLAEAGFQVPAVEAVMRYQWVSEVLDGVIQHPDQRPTTLGDRLDHVVTHRFWGTILFAMMMILMFQSIFSWATPLMDLLEQVVGWLGEAVGSAVPSGALQSLLVDGVIAGVGGVLVFLPQIFILFFFIALLEDCGYMARAAYLMDKLMARVGLSGKSFIPLLSSFACAIPGIMAARTIENRRDRLVTILVAPLMSCSARLPVYVLLIAAFIPDRPLLGRWLGLQGVTMFAMYSVGIVAAVAVAWILKNSLLRGETPPFVMELPSYKLPSLVNVVTRMTERGWSFVRRAGTLILAVSIIVWAAAYFPRSPEVAAGVEARFQPQIDQARQQLDNVPDNAAGQAQRQQLEAQIAEWETSLDGQLAAAYIEQSYLGSMGRIVEPVVRPLGWDWRIGCAVIASFPAREVVIGAMGVIYNLGEDQDEQSEPLKERLREVTWEGSSRKVFNVPVALSIMVFFALCAQCAATLVIMRRETNSWTWPVFTFVYMTGLAYVAAFVTYRVGMAWMGA